MTEIPAEIGTIHPNFVGGEMITHYPETGHEMDGMSGVSWDVYPYACSSCQAKMVEVTPDFEPPEFPLCAACRNEPLATHLHSEIISDN